MKIVITLLIIIGCIFLIILVTGLLLPEQRSVTIQTIYDESPKDIYDIITNNTDYSYRSDLKEIIIIEKDGEFEIWDEVDNKGNTIRFKTVLKEPYTRYEFDIIKGNGFTGRWIGELNETGNGGTIFITTETIYIKNPFIRVLSYVFFDIKKFMESYQKDLAAHLKNKQI